MAQQNVERTPSITDDIEEGISRMIDEGGYVLEPSYPWGRQSLSQQVIDSKITETESDA